MNEIIPKQTQEVLQQLQQREYPAEQMPAINRKISQAHQAVINRVEHFMDAELDRVEQEIVQLEQQLIEKLAERRELTAWYRHIGYQTGIQVHVELNIGEKEGEKHV